MVTSVDFVVLLHRLDVVLLQTLELTHLICILIMLSLSLLKYKILGREVVRHMPHLKHGVFSIDTAQPV